MNIILFKFTHEITGRFMMKNKIKLAFTLSEVLITLGIIGVVSAMTIPTLISKYQKHIVEANLQESYSIIQQVMKYTEYHGECLDADRAVQGEWS